MNFNEKSKLTLNFKRRCAFKKWSIALGYDPVNRYLSVLKLYIPEGRGEGNKINIYFSSIASKVVVFYCIDLVRLIDALTVINEFQLDCAGL